MNKCGHDNCDTCPYPDCEPKYWKSESSAEKRKASENRAQRKKDYSKEYYHANKEKERARSKAWKEKNKDKIASYNAKARAIRKEKIEAKKRDEMQRLGMYFVSVS